MTLIDALLKQARAQTPEQIAEGLSRVAAQSRRRVLALAAEGASADDIHRRTGITRRFIDKTLNDAATS